MSVEHFEKGIERRLLAVNKRLKEGTYEPKPVKRVMIPKAGSAELRPLGAERSETAYDEGVAPKG
jgi:retron-type reverse transcriptase